MSQLLPLLAGVILLCCVVKPCAQAQPQAFTMQLQLIEPRPGNGGYCMDGTPAGYYYRPNANDKHNNDWVIELEGGGACFSKATCDPRAKSRLGSSSYWTNETVGTSITSPNPFVNPDFAEWNHVFVPYCTSDVHAGM
eukprot:TRINITY_DN12195_c0_g1_i1.p4 TRINITY_DN12195_c0_g1~~TRINITY_DN12195_c0_g1_i1.p4  ORF type:complete len:138 (+),score=34.48 TRINITY_DN12195_c0_g1_i1:285-698(+)